MKIQVCTWRKCKSNFSEYILKRIENDSKKYNLKKIIYEPCLCLWECSKWPNVLIDWKLQNYYDPLKISKVINNK